MHPGKKPGVLFAVLAAVFYALNSPVSKLLLGSIPPAMMAAFLYLGAGLGMALIQPILNRRQNAPQEERLTRRELPWTLMMIVLDIAAPISLMLGINLTSAATASLLNNFEIVTTSLIALLFFRERISGKLWLGIGLVTLSAFLLSMEDISGFTLSPGALFVLLACLCWGLENNCTRRLSSKNPVQIVVIKGIFSGLGALIVAFLSGENLPALWRILPALCLGFVAYGLSIVCYIYAQRELGAAKTSAYYAIAPFIGVLLSLVIFLELPSPWFFTALVIMILGTWLVTAADCAE
ncbi:MAG: DMT family transporter [Clostridiales bacterium]|nr:DMT family transporter [Clostridiales bacterium]